MSTYHQKLRSARLYAILDTTYVETSQLAKVAAAMINAGVDIIQLRAKKLPADDIRKHANILCPLIHAAGIPFIINDHPAIAGEIGAAGVHVGQDDMSVEEARQLAGRPDAIIGKSTHSIAQATAAMSESPDYIGYGPLYANQTKPDYTPVGLHDIQAVRQVSTVPVFCIGGIKEHNLDHVLEAGAQRIVIVSELLGSTDIPAYCRRVRAKIGVHRTA
jgi:thiamine-phosphate pyrophosphorylase